MKFSLKKGKRYKASIVLGMFERMVSNEQLAVELKNIGFTDIIVSGQGGVRYIVAKWDRADATREIPRQVHEIIELKPLKVEPDVIPPPPDVPAPKVAPKPSAPAPVQKKPWWKVW